MKLEIRLVAGHRYRLEVNGVMYPDVIESQEQFEVVQRQLNLRDGDEVSVLEIPQ